MRLRAVAVMAGIALTSVFIGPGVEAGKSAATTGTVACGTGTVTYTPTTKWPPNHKLFTVNASFDDADNDGDTITLSVDSVTNDEQDIEKGSTAKHGPDVVGVPVSDSGTDSIDPATPDPAAVAFQLRKERLGKGDGRVYTVNVTCTDAGDVSLTAPETATAVLLVTIPHDQGK